MNINWANGSQMQLLLTLYLTCCATSLIAQTKPEGVGAEATQPSVCAEGDWAPIYARCNVKLGFPKIEAAKILTESQRNFLDGVLRIYQTPALLANRTEAISTIGAKIHETRYNDTVWPSGRQTQSRTDTFKGEGLFTPFEYWASFYTKPAYDPSRVEERGYVWGAKLEVHIDRKRECVPSRAVEGYLDIPLSARIFGTIPPIPRERWNRHRFGGAAGAPRLSSLHPNLEIGFTEQCLTTIRLQAVYFSKELSDDNIHN